MDRHRPDDRYPARPMPALRFCLWLALCLLAALASAKAQTPTLKAQAPTPPARRPLVRMSAMRQELKTAQAARPRPVARPKHRRRR